jgi:cation transport ATPase
LDEDLRANPNKPTIVATLWMAIAADMGASLLVIGNGLRLLRAK